MKAAYSLFIFAAFSVFSLTADASDNSKACRKISGGDPGMLNICQAFPEKSASLVYACGDVARGNVGMLNVCLSSPTAKEADVRRCGKKAGANVGAFNLCLGHSAIAHEPASTKWKCELTPALPADLAVVGSLLVHSSTQHILGQGATREEAVSDAAKACLLPNGSVRNSRETCAAARKKAVCAVKDRNGFFQTSDISNDQPEEEKSESQDAG